MKIVIFGTGFVGGALVREFELRGHEVTAVSRSPTTKLPANVKSVSAETGLHVETVRDRSREFARALGFDTTFPHAST